MILRHDTRLLQEKRPVGIFNSLSYILQREWPTSLSAFIQEAETLSYPRIPDQQCFLKLGKNSQRGMKPKKIHEVKHMSALVHEVCQEVGCNHIVDVGAGLVSSQNSGILECIVNLINLTYYAMDSFQ